jgi:hypothetical protein
VGIPAALPLSRTGCPSQRRGARSTMTMTERPPVPAIECTPWCERGDGHPPEIFASDQTCRGEQHVTPACINNEDDADRVAHRCGRGGYPNVCLNVYVRDTDIDVYLTIGQAPTAGRVTDGRLVVRPAQLSGGGPDSDATWISRRQFHLLRKHLTRIAIPPPTKS